MSDTLATRDTYSIGVEYEVLRNSLNKEIAYHAHTASQAGHESPKGTRHMNMVRNLTDLRDSVSPFDEQQIQMIATLLQDIQLDRMERPPVPMHATES